MPTKKGKQQRLLKLVQQAERFNTGGNQPPDAAAAALGRALGKEFSEDHHHDAVLDLLCTLNLNPSIPEGFFSVVKEDDFLLDWISRIEQASLTTSVACIRAVVRHSIHRSEASLTLRGYQSLLLASSKAVYVETFLAKVLTKDRTISEAQNLLAPLLATALLSSSSAPFEQSLVLRQLWIGLRERWAYWTYDDCFSMLFWLTRALNLYLGIPSGDTEKELLRVQYAESWLNEMISLVLAFAEDQHSSVMQQLYGWMELITNQTLPQLLRSCFGSWYTVLGSVTEFVNAFDFSKQVVSIPLLPTTAFRLCNLLLKSPEKEKKETFLQFLSTQYVQDRLMVSSEIVVSLFENMCTLLEPDLDTSPSIQTFRYELGCSHEARKRNDQSFVHSDDKFEPHCNEALISSEEKSLKWTSLASGDFSELSLTMSQQTMWLLFVTSHLAKDDIQDERYFGLLDRLFAQYPHLGITMIPLLLRLLNTAALQRDGAKVLRCLQFAAKSLTLDSSAAKEVWHLLGSQWLNQHSPLKVRIMTIRLLPMLCDANRKLYRRVVDEIGVFVSDKNPEIRLAVSSTLVELSENGHIQDVSDVIGWIQQLLMEDRELPIHSLIVRQALLSLHFLCANGELEFDLVIKVLSKRLCSIRDIQRLCDLPTVVLEALADLLGDGELENESSDEEEPETSSTPSPQVQASVVALISIGKKALEQLSGDSIEGALSTSLVRNVFRSLCRYSVSTLGLGEDDVKSTLSASDGTNESSPISNYCQLSQLALLAIEKTGTFVYSPRLDPVSPLVELSRTIVRAELECVGTSSFWQKHAHHQLGRHASTRRQSTAALSALPKKSDVLTLLDNPPQLATSIATLLASESSHISVLRDNVDAAIETSDPMLLTFAIKSIMKVASQYFDTEPDSHGSRDWYDEIRQWNEVFVSPDAMFLLISCFAVVGSGRDSSDIGEGFDDVTTEICGEVLSAAASNSFQRDDIARICMGCAGYIAMQKGIVDRSLEVVRSLENSIRGFGGQQSFGSYFAMAFIAQGSLRMGAEARQVVARVCGFLLEELLSCFEESGDEPISLVACVKSGEATKDLLSSFEGIDYDSVSILMTKQVVAQHILISCSYCLPALYYVDRLLLLSVLRFLQTLEWVNGKGIALAAVIEKARSSGLLSPRDVQEIRTMYVDEFERIVEEGEDNDDALDELFYLSYMFSKRASSLTVRRLLVGNSDLFDDDGRALSLVACASSVVMIPNLGTLPFVEDAMLLRETAESEVKGVVEVVSKAASRGDGSKYCAMGLILLALLSGIEKVSETDQADAAPHKSTAATLTRTLIDFQQLPSPPAGTLSSELLSLLGSIIQGESEDTRGSENLVFSILQTLDLPGKFASTLLAPILRDRTECRIPAIRLLLSQLKRRRTALRDGSEFLTQVLFLYTASGSDKMSDPKEAEIEAMVESLNGIAPRIPVDKLYSILSGVWTHCDPNDDVGRATRFLSQLQKVLNNAGLSPKALSNVQDFLFRDMFPCVSSVSLGHSMTKGAENSLVEALVGCFLQIPFSVLDEKQIFHIGGPTIPVAEEPVRAAIILLLCRYDGYVSRDCKNKISLSTSWIHQNLSYAEDTRECLVTRRLLCAYAFTLQTRYDWNERLSKVFELLLLAPADAGAGSLESLGIAAALWSRLRENDMSFSFLFAAAMDTAESLTDDLLGEFVRLAVEQLPTNLADVLNDDRAVDGSTVHQLYRLYEKWKNVDGGKRQADTLRQCCLRLKHGLIESSLIDSLLVTSLQC